MEGPVDLIPRISDKLQLLGYTIQRIFLEPFILGFWYFNKGPLQQRMFSVAFYNADFRLSYKSLSDAVHLVKETLKTC